MYQLIVSVFFMQIFITEETSPSIQSGIRDKREDMAPQSNEQHYVEYCRQDCSGIDQTGTYNGNCQRCNCDSSCYINRDCCPDKILKDSTEGNIQNPEVMAKCLLNTFPAIIDIENAYLMVSDCPADQTDQTNILKQKCSINTDLRLATFQPITDHVTNVTYRNKYCAECNNVINGESWEIEYRCRGSMPQNFGKTLEEAEEIISNFSNCHIFVKPPPNMPSVRPCLTTSGNEISKCNGTGQWSEFDDQTKAACDNSASLTVKGYSNLFCYKCNTNKDWIVLNKDTFNKRSSGPKFSDFIPIVLIPDRSLIPPELQILQIWDPYQKECIDVGCYDGKLLINGTCRPIYSKSNAYGFYMCLDYSVKVSARSRGTLFNTDAARAIGYKLLYKSSKNMMRVYIKNINYFLGPCGDPVFGKSQIFYRFVTLEALLSVDDEMSDLIRRVEEYSTVQQKDGLFGKPTRSCSKTALSEQEGPFCEAKLSNVYEKDEDASRILYLKDNTIPLAVSKLYLCPHVTIPLSSGFLSDDDNMLTVLTTEKNLTTFEFDVTEEGYKVCVEDYIENVTDIYYSRCNVAKPNPTKPNQTGTAWTNQPLFLTMLFSPIFILLMV